MSIELPTKIWADLQPALERRAMRVSAQAGAEIAPSFTAWLRDKAKETIAQYK